MTRTSKTSDPWTGAEAQAVREALRTAQQRMVVGPAPMHRFAPELAPDRLPAGSFRHRSRRWAAPALGAVAVAVTVLSVALIDPWSDSAPAEVAGALALPDGPATGSLAADPSVLAALRSRFTEQVEGSRDVHLVLATDVPGGRLALARWPGADGRHAGWLVGARGAEPGSMVAGDSCDPVAPCWVRYGAGFSFVDDVKPDGTVVRPVDRGEGLVVATAPGARVVVRAGNDVTSAGALERASARGRERWPGVFDVELPSASGRLDVEVRGAGEGRWTGWSSAGSSRDADSWWTAASVGLRGTPVGAGPTVRGDLAGAVLQATAMPLTEGSRVLWSTASTARSASAAAPAADRAVVAVRGTSGGWALVAVSRSEAADGSFSVRVEAVRPVAAGDPDRLAFAWSETTDAVRVVGPVAAVRARIATGSGTVVLDLARGVGAAPAAGARTVTFLDAAGRSLGRAPVTPRWRTGQVLGRP